MQIPRETIVDFLRQQGEQERAGAAEQHLPDQVDPDRHRNLLEQLGIEPAELLGRPGGGGIPGL